ncbi:MAG: hypothetical protein ACYDHM_11085 [Acidiferrobacterales bacterium]
MHASLTRQPWTVRINLDPEIRRPRAAGIRSARPVSLLLLLLLIVVHAARAVVSIDVGRDVVFGHASRGLFLGYQPPAQHWAYFAGGWRGYYNDEIYGAGYDCGFGRLSLQLGVSYITHINYINGTHWNFDTDVAYRLTHHWALSWRHFSNANFITHWSNGPNRGWNFVSIEYLFDRGKGSGHETCIP